jgi:hypothetical protein
LSIIYQKNASAFAGAIYELKHIHNMRFSYLPSTSVIGLASMIASFFFSYQTPQPAAASKVILKGGITGKTRFL